MYIHVIIFLLIRKSDLGGGREGKCIMWDTPLLISQGNTNSTLSYMIIKYGKKYFFVRGHQNLRTATNGQENITANRKHLLITHLSLAWTILLVFQIFWFLEQVLYLAEGWKSLGSILEKALYLVFPMFSEDEKVLIAGVSQSRIFEITTRLCLRSNVTLFTCSS